MEIGEFKDKFKKMNNVSKNSKIFLGIIIVILLIVGAIYLSNYFRTLGSNTSSPYSLPRCYSSDCDCSDFSTQAYAQWFHDNYDKQDKHRLDGNKDGVVCESLP